MTRFGQFLVTCAIFHAGALSLSAWTARAWVAVSRRPALDKVRALVVGGAALLLAITVWAALCSLLGPRSGFTVIRLISQALFSEVLLITVLVAAREGRSSPGRALAFASIPLGLLGIYWDSYHREPTGLVIRTHEVDLS